MPKYLIKKIINSHYPINKLLITSNYLEVINIIKQELPEIRVGWVFHSTGNELKQLFWFLLVKSLEPLLQSYILKKMLVHRINILILYYKLATKELINKLHKSDIKVYVWTIDSKKKINKYQMNGNGVDGIISNYPNKF